MTTYFYDTANRLTKKTHSDTTGTVTYVYGTSAASYNIGRLLTMTDPSGSETYTYDQMGRVTQLAKTIGTTTYTTKYAYNAGGQLTQITYPSGRNVYNVYDNVGHLCSISAVSVTSCGSTSPYLTIASSSYDAAGRPLVATYGNGVVAGATYSPQRGELASLAVGASGGAVSTSSSSVSEGPSFCEPPPILRCFPALATFTVTSSAGFTVNDSVTVSGNSLLNGTWPVYDVSSSTQVTLNLGFGGSRASGTGGTLTDNTAVRAPGPPFLLSLNYFYQQNSTSCLTGKTLNNGQIQCITDSSVGTGDSGRSVAYTYDYLGRLSTASTTGSTAFGKWGLSETYDRYGNRSAQTALPGTVGTVPQPSFSINALNNQINTSGYTYDLSGHLTAEPAPFNTSYTYDGEDCLTNYHSGLNGNTATYTCDGNHFRVKKVVTGPNAITTVSIYSGGQVIAEYDNGAGVTSPSREYIYGHNLLATITGSTGGTGGTITYLHRDHRSPRLYTNSTGANTGEQGTYPFGEPWYTSNATSNWVFTTYERDAESGIDYALARSYHSGEGRFMSPDPVEGKPGSPQSWDRYTYAMNDPVNSSDPSGQDCFDGVNCPSGATWSGGQLTLGGQVAGDTWSNPWQTPYVTSTTSFDSMTGDVTGTGMVGCTGEVCGYFAGSSFADAGSFSDTSSASSGFSALDGLQLGLAGVGMIPGPWGQGANFLNGAIFIGRGQYWAGGASILAAGLPLGGRLIAEAGRAAEVAKAAEDAALAAQAAGAERGAAAALQVGDEMFTDLSSGARLEVGGTPTPVNPTVQEALDSVPEGERSAFHGKCAEIGCLSKALDAGVDPAGGRVATARIAAQGNPAQGMAMQPCSSCASVLRSLGVPF